MLVTLGLLTWRKPASSGDDRGVKKPPKNPLRRGAKLAGLPLSYAGRRAAALGRKVTGTDSPEKIEKDQDAAAKELFAVLGQLKGGAMKFGQALSVLEGAMPDHVAEPWRAELTKLQDKAPALEFPSINQVLCEELGDQWRSEFTDFDENAAAAASIGQVHKATFHDGRQVAVKVQYPNADAALMQDIRALARLGKVAGGAIPGIDMKPLLNELEERAEEELNYELEASRQRVFADAFADSDLIAVPQVVRSTRRVLVTEWLDGEPLSTVIADGSQEDRNIMSRRYLEFLLLGPREAGLLHADPHPGNFRKMPDGRFGVLDFGAVKELPDGMPPAIGRLLTECLVDGGDEVVEGLRDEGFIKAALQVNTEDLMKYLEPFLLPARTEQFHFTRDWIGGLFTHVKDPRGEQWSMGLKLNLPPEYLLIHRVWGGGLGVMCQLGGIVPVLDVFEELLPEFSKPQQADS